MLTNILWMAVAAYVVGFPVVWVAATAWLIQREDERRKADKPYFEYSVTLTGLGALIATAWPVTVLGYLVFQAAQSLNTKKEEDA